MNPIFEKGRLSAHCVSAIERNILRTSRYTDERINGAVNKRLMQSNQ